MFKNPRTSLLIKQHVNILIKLNILKISQWYILGIKEFFLKFTGQVMKNDDF